MRRFITGLCVCAVAFAGGGAYAQSVDVALYNDAGHPEAGVWQTGLSAIKAMLDAAGISHEDISPEQINRTPGVLSSYRMFLVGGGWAGSYNQLINPSGMAGIREYVASGGAYLGICAGALFACDRITWQPDYASPLETYDYPLDLFSGIGHAPVLAIKEWTAATGCAEIQTGATMTNIVIDGSMLPDAPTNPCVLYYGGPRFEIPASVFADTDVIARYVVPGDSADNTPAMIRFSYGAGRVCLVGPHAEVSLRSSGTYTDPENWRILQSAIGQLLADPADDQPVPADYDGDRRSDLAVYRPGSGVWRIRRSSDGGLLSVHWGGAGMAPLSGADFDGDEHADVTIWNESACAWYAASSSGTTLLWGVAWGGNGMCPVLGDYDADGRDDMAVYDESSGCWFIRSAGFDGDPTVLAWALPWGGSGLVPVAGDYDGDGTNDLAVYSESQGFWCIRSMAGVVFAWMEAWGGTGFQAVSGDYDGDGCADLALYESASGHWFIRSSTGRVLAWSVLWGGADYVPASMDFDGDGVSDLAVFQAASGRWYVADLNGGILAWGLAWGGD